MDNVIWVAFVTGLTAGGLSCMAVQGGLVTGSLANQMEKDIQDSAQQKNKQQKAAGKKKISVAKPILLFLAAKITAYTLLGLLLGALGTVLSLTPRVRGILQLLIALFMIGNALRMLNVHPIFRFFSFEPPRFITRYIRKKSKSADSFFAPIFLGFLTIFIPCGVSQSMMALAVAAGNPLTGAVIMFAFTLGTSPVFFGLTYLATKLSSLIEKYFVRIVAIVLLLLGIFAFDAGLNLLGSPYTLSRISELWTPKTTEVASVKITPSVNSLSNEQGTDPGIQSNSTPETAQAPGTITLYVTNNGYQPRILLAPANQTIHLNLVSQNTYSCSRAFVIPGLNFSAVLPETGSQIVDIPPQKSGTQMPFTCSMGMFTGVIQFQ
jgi:sulfite exporter TauE/SafE